MIRRINENYEYLKNQINFSDFDEKKIEDMILFVKKLRRKQDKIAKQSDYENVSACDFVEGADGVIDVLNSLLIDGFDTVDEFVDALDWCERQSGSSYVSELISVNNVINGILKDGKILEYKNLSFQKKLKKNESEYNLNLDDEEFNQHIEDTDKKSRIKLPDKITLDWFSWSKIGRLDGHDLYLCDGFVAERPVTYGFRNDWKSSDLRKWLNNDFYKGLINDEYNIVNEIVKNEDGDKMFLLSIDEYNKFKKNIKNINRQWWLRSPDREDRNRLHTLCVYTDGSVFSCQSSKYEFVRPAFLY